MTLYPKKKFLWKSAKKNTTCWICSEKINANEYMATLKSGSHYINICLNHLKISNCEICKHQFTCLTNEGKSICVDGYKISSYFSNGDITSFKPKI